MLNWFRNKRKARIKGSSEIDVEEIFLDKMLKEIRGKDEILARKIELPLEKSSFLFVLFSGFFIILFLWGFTFKFQFFEADKYNALANANKFALSNIDAERGVIYDRQMKQLAFNKTEFSLWFDGNNLTKKSGNYANGDVGQSLIKSLAGITGQDPKEIKEKIEKAKQEPVLIKDNLPRQELILFKVNQDKFPGFEVKKKIDREYETAGALSHILGYLNKVSAKDLQTLKGYGINDYIGRAGLEKSYEGVLKEKKGEVKIERDAKGNIISKKIVKYPQSGDSLVLSLDFFLQQKAAEILGNVLKETNTKAGVVTALDPNNGQVLALVSLPAFDNNLFAKGISEKEFQKILNDKSKPELDRATSGLYPTGSTIKPLIALAALQEGIIQENTVLYCPLELCLYNKYSKKKECFPDWRFHGFTDVKRAIAESVNPFFYMIGGGYIAPNSADPRLPKKLKGLGVNRIKKYLTLFGFGEKTGIDLPSESVGRVPDPEWKKEYFAKNPALQEWHIGDTYNLSIGQGYLLATPLQVAKAFVAIANGGTLYKPSLVEKIINSSQKIIREIKPQIERNNFVDLKNIEIVRAGMRQAVVSPAGSAFSLNSLPVTAAAKTGTAQIRTGADVYDNWIAVFAPYDHPKIVLVVMVENVEHTRIVAQKIAKEVLSWYFSQDLKNH